MAGLRRVVVGVSGSPGSVRALRYAAHLARSDGASLIAVLAWVPPGGDLAERRMPSMYLRQVWAEAAASRLTDALDAAWGGIPADLPVQRVVARGEPGCVIVTVAGEPDDLIVVGTGDQNPLTRLWHGNVARYCLRRASCPVLAIPPSPLARDLRGFRRWVRAHQRLEPDAVGIGP